MSKDIKKFQRTKLKLQIVRSTKPLINQRNTTQRFLILLTRMLVPVDPKPWVN